MAGVIPVFEVLSAAVLDNGIDAIAHIGKDQTRELKIGFLLERPPIIGGVTLKIKRTSNLPSWLANLDSYWPDPSLTITVLRGSKVNRHAQ